MTQTTTIDGVSRTSVIKRSECEWSESAYLGEVGTGRLRIDDDAGTITVVGHKTIVTEQSATTAWPRLFTGFVGRKTYGRGDQYVTGASREISVETKDANDLLARLKITGTDGNRKSETSETLATLGAWLLASDYWPASVSDYGAVDFPATIGIDGNDWRGSYPGDVLAAMAKKANYNYYVRYNDDENGFELVFRDDNASTDDTSTISIINDGTANSTSTFAPAQDHTLEEDPEHVYSGVMAHHAKGTVYATRAATATAFVERDGTTDDSGIKSAASAELEADQFLWESHTEEHLLRVTLRMRAAYVNLIRPGQRVSVTMTNLATQGYNSATFFRVLRRKVTQPLDTDNDYDVALDLSPQEAAQPAGQIIQSAFGRGSSGQPTLTLPNPVTIDGGGGDHVLVAILTDRNNGLPLSPSDDGGIWTRLNGVAETSAEHGSGNASGIAAYWKVTDSTDNTIDFHDYTCFGVWELDGVDMTSATLVTKDAQTSTASPVTMNAGSLGSPAAGEIVLAGFVVVNKAETTGFGDYRTSGIVGVAVSPSGLTQRFWNGPADFSYGIWPATYYPLAWFGDLEGDGSACSPTITRPSGLSDPPNNSSGTTAWAAIAIKVPAA